jgi:magnesium transporter
VARRKRGAKRQRRRGRELAAPAAAEPTSIHVFEYAKDVVRERDVDDPEQLRPYLKPQTTVWVEVKGFADRAKLARIAELFGLHPLVLEDALNVPQRAKSEAHAHEHVIVCRIPVIVDGPEIATPQVCMILGHSWLITFQDRSRGFFDPVRKLIRDGVSPIRELGADYLAYALIDAVVDRYFPVVESLTSELEDLEAEVLERAAPDVLARVQHVRHALSVIRRVGWPQREALGELAREPSSFVTDEARRYLHTAEQHIRQIIELVDSSRELAGVLTEIYLSQVGQRTNEVMKVLTLVSSIFIPLTFVVGVYGMNFEYMPELHSPLGYPLVLLAMAAIAFGLILWFRRRGWWD